MGAPAVSRADHAALTVQALETLAVIAYRQPITALEISEIRGVNTSGVLNTLLERHLIKIVGRKQVVGRPFLYATTKEFLIRFGLNDLNDLPKVEDMAEALGLEAPMLVERTPPEEQLPLEEPDGPREEGRAARSAGPAPPLGPACGPTLRPAAWATPCAVRSWQFPAGSAVSTRRA